MGVRIKKLPSDDLRCTFIADGRRCQSGIIGQGIETEHPMLLLERFGCDLLQGYLLAEANERREPDGVVEIAAGIKN